MVSPESRMLSAISFGVFWRSAPSTRAIIRSMKPSPGFWVMRTTISSESTRVPPVTADRSPPDSRMTGADSPVMADSSTLAMPSTISPSPGMTSPATTTQRSPSASSLEAFSSDRAVGRPHPGERLGAGLAERVGLRLAPALGDRLGEVGEQHGEPEPGRHQPHEQVVDARRRSRSRKNRSVVSTLPTSTTNITGLRIIVRGWSLTTLSHCGPPEDARFEQGGPLRDPLLGVRHPGLGRFGSAGDEGLADHDALLDAQLLDEGAEREEGK